MPGLLVAVAQVPLRQATPAGRRLRITTTRHRDPEGCRRRCKGSRWVLDAQAPLGLECDSMTCVVSTLVCVFCCLRSGLGNVVFCTALHRAAPTVPSSSASGWGLFLDLGAPLANLTGTLPRLGNLRAPDGLLT